MFTSLNAQKTLSLAPVSLSLPLPNTQSALIGQFIHSWAITASNARTAVLNHFLGAKLT